MSALALQPVPQLDKTSWDSIWKHFLLHGLQWWLSKGDHSSRSPRQNPKHTQAPQCCDWEYEKTARRCSGICEMNTRFNLLSSICWFKPLNLPAIYSRNICADCLKWFRLHYLRAFQFLMFPFYRSFTGFTFDVPVNAPQQKSQNSVSAVFTR